MSSVEARSPHPWVPWLMIGVLLLSAALAWHDLGAREVLGQDENATITKLDQPGLQAVLDVTYMKVTGQPGNMQPLYFLLQHLFWPLIKPSAFLLRFLSSLCYVLVVALTYKLGAVLLGREAGAIGALLTALLPLHVHYAQIARPYAMLAALSLASAYFLLRALQTNRLAHWVGFVLTATLSFYTHYNALLVLAAEGLFAGAVWLVMLATTLKTRRAPRRLLGPVFAFLAVGALCLPGLVRLSNLPLEEVSGKVRVELTVQFFYRFLYKIGLTTVWLRGLVLGFMGLGLAKALYARRWRSVLFIVLWLAIPFVTLSVIKSPRPFVERYVIFVPPVALLLAGEGVVALGQLLGRRWSEQGVQRAATIILTCGLILLLVPPLRAYYTTNHEVDRLDLTLAIVERHARPGDLVLVSPRFFVRSLDAGAATVLYLTDHLSPSEFEDLLARYQRTWVLYTSYLPPAELQEPLDQWIQARPDEFVRVPIKAITALAYRDRSLADPETLLQEQVTVLEELASVSAVYKDRQEAWLRHEALAQAYEALADLYEGQGDSGLADEYRDKAEESRAAAPRPW